MAASADWNGSPRGMRSSENAVRLLLIEHSREYAALVCEALFKFVATWNPGGFGIAHSAWQTPVGNTFGAVLQVHFPWPAVAAAVTLVFFFTLGLPKIQATGVAAGSRLHGSFGLVVSLPQIRATGQSLIKLPGKLHRHLIFDRP